MTLKVKKRDGVTFTHPATEQIVSVMTEKVRLNVEMPKSKRQALKARAAVEDRTINDIINQLVDQYLTG